MRLLHKTVAGLILFSMVSGGSGIRVEAKPADTLKAAFVRDGDLWFKKGDAERQMTKGEHIRYPKWSFDGEWVAYSQGKEGEELRLLHVPTGRNRVVAHVKGLRNYQWAPGRNELAYQDGQKLLWMRADKPDAPAEAAQGIGNFSWLPDGNGFIASTQAELLPSGSWTPVDIVEIPLKGTPAAKTTKRLFELPKMSEDFFAVDTSGFKYSRSGRWIAFIANPTASLSADSNTLCLLSADGSLFRKVDQMLNDERWFQWADRTDRLAYIGGIGREATSNKRLMVLDAPEGKPVSFTPKGYVDQGFTWEGEPHIIVSRAKEQTGSKPKPFSPQAQLVEIKLQGARYKPITQPPVRYGDSGPQYFPRAGQLAWVRSGNEKADVLVSGRGGKHPSVWIKDIDPVDGFYGRWDWNAVLDIDS
ncbi:translocation protein TolB [Cohnella endophytica]|uniref:Translocation protein TolB n=1 Tax=Cohnella endophytica TaxID=2419778 RepID=A0A494XLU0_9BACL|nr:translocation protein TolB [Cohnella endophytica]RKP51665.1 translocation protein TolB [Cohnella endophytica]